MVSELARMGTNMAKDSFKLQGHAGCHQREKKEAGKQL